MREEKTVAVNRAARHEYHIEESLEVGIELQGTEVKSIRRGNANLKDSFARVEKGQVYLYNMHVSPYEQGNRYNHDPLRTRRLLLHKREINRFFGKVREAGYSLIPLKLYINAKGRVKMELALGRGKKLFDKREDAAKKDAHRQAEKALKERTLGV